MYLRFNREPPVQKIRDSLSGKIRGEITVQQVTGRPEVLVGTEIANEKELNANRQILEDTLRATFGAPADKLDLNNSAGDQLANRLRDPLLQAGVAMSEQDLQDTVKAIEDFRASRGGILNNFDELSGVKGVTPPVLQALKKECALGSFTILSAEVVGPKVGAQLTRQAILATLYALGGMLVYVAFRFEWIYGVAAVVAVFHDTIITIGLFSLLDKEISLTVVAALLTLVGYSMNDTIVVFDRIRENLKLMRRESLEGLINISVNQTLSRTVLTSGLTLLTALSLVPVRRRSAERIFFRAGLWDYRGNVFIRIYREPDPDILAEPPGFGKAAGIRPAAGRDQAGAAGRSWPEPGSRRDGNRETRGERQCSSNHS